MSFIFYQVVCELWPFAKIVNLLKNIFNRIATHVSNTNSFQLINFLNFPSIYMGVIAICINLHTHLGSYISDALVLPLNGPNDHTVLMDD